MNLNLHTVVYGQEWRITVITNNKWEIRKSRGGHNFIPRTVKTKTASSMHEMTYAYFERRGNKAISTARPVSISFALKFQTWQVLVGCVNLEIEIKL